MHRLRAKGNRIVDSQGQEFLFKGISINSPGLLIEEDHDFLDDIRRISDFGANAVKTPICPAYWQSMSDYCERILDPIVDLAEDLGLYCCLDWHAQGNVATGKTREYGNVLINGYEKYDANAQLALDANEKLSKRYGKRSHVVFDIFSMPIDIEASVWRDRAQQLVSIVREHTDNLVFVAGADWTSDLEWVLDEPIDAPNVVYGLSYYPMEMFQDTAILEVKKRFPVFLPECGWTPEGYFQGTREEYGNKLLDYVKNHSIGFFAWCYHPERVPVLLNSWDPSDLSEWGVFLRDELLTTD